LKGCCNNVAWKTAPGEGKIYKQKIYLVIFDKSADDVGIAHISEDAYEDIFRHIHTFLAKYAA